MGSGNSTTETGAQPTATNTGLSNAFMSNQPLQQTYAPMPLPSAPSSSFSQLSGAGSLPGLTGSLIGNGGAGMPALPQPSGPMPLPPPPRQIAPMPSQAARNTYQPENFRVSTMKDTIYDQKGNVKPQYLFNRLHSSR